MVGTVQLLLLLTVWLGMWCSSFLLRSDVEAVQAVSLWVEPVAKLHYAAPLLHLAAPCYCKRIWQWPVGVD